MSEGRIPEEPVWRPGAGGRLRALVRRTLAAMFGPRGEAAAHAAYHAVLRRLGRFGPTEDPITMTLLRTAASHAVTFIDVGANVGRYSWFLRQHASRDATVVALEPHPGAARLLRRALAQRPHDLVLEVAAGDEDGTATLVVPRGAFGASVPGLGWVDPAMSPRDDAQEIRIRRIDGLVEDGTLPVTGPVFIKIDVEGAELSVFRGSAALLRNHRPVIYFECQAELLRRRGETSEAVWDYLVQAGYSLFTSRGGAFVPVNGTAAGIVNYLAIPDVASTGPVRMDAEGLRRVLSSWAASSRAGGP